MPTLWLHKEGFFLIHVYLFISKPQCYLTSHHLFLRLLLCFKWPVVSVIAYSCCCCFYIFTETREIFLKHKYNYIVFPAWKSSVTSHFSSVQSLSCVQLFVTPWITARQTSLPITNSLSLPKPMSIESVMPSNHLILCRPLLLLPSIFPSIKVFSNESALRIRWPKYWSFSFNISPSNEHPGPVSFRFDWLDILAVQGTLKSLLQHHSSKASILWHSAFFIV